MAGHPLRPATHRRLGRPLPHQQANLTRAHLIAKASKERPSFPRRVYAVLARVSSGCPPLLGRFLRVTHPSATLLRPKPFRVRLACVKHAASVQSEPGSNSSVQSIAATTVTGSFRSTVHLLVEGAPPRFCRLRQPRRSTHTSYPNVLLKNSPPPRPIPPSPQPPNPGARRATTQQLKQGRPTILPLPAATSSAFCGACSTLEDSICGPHALRWDSA